MIKRRTQNDTQSESEFIEGATAYQDNYTHTSNGSGDNLDQKLDPKAPRKFKSHTLPLNEYEHNLLVELADKYGQTHSGIIRFALKKLAEL